MVSSGSMSATDAAYIDFNPSGTDSLNYGALAFGSGSVKVLDSLDSPSTKDPYGSVTPGLL
jgi:hypothetical protein